jgi:hypothetical protein
MAYNEPVGWTAKRYVDAAVDTSSTMSLWGIGLGTANKAVAEDVQTFMADAIVRPVNNVVRDVCAARPIEVGLQALL